MNRPLIFFILVLLGALAAAGWLIREAYTDLGEARMEAALAQEEASRIDRAAAQAEAFNTARIQAKERIHTEVKELIREVPIRVPAASSCPLPGGWRMLHDAAATGNPPPPPGGPDDPPASPQDAAATVVDNYGTCRDIANQLRGLQQWVTRNSTPPRP